MQKVSKVEMAKEFVKFCLDYRVKLNKLKAQEEMRKQGNGYQNPKKTKSFDKIPFPTFLDKAVEFSKTFTNTEFKEFTSLFEDFIPFLIIYTLLARTEVELNWKYKEKKQKSEK